MGQRLDMALDPLEHDRLPVGGIRTITRLRSPLERFVVIRFLGFRAIGHWI